MTLDSIHYADLIGKSFAWGGRGPDSYDCWGLVACVLRRSGVEAPDYPSSQEGALNAATLMQAASGGEWVKVENPEPGCVVVFRMDLPWPSHVGIVTDGSWFLHVSEIGNRGAVLEKLTAPVWRKRVVAYYRWHEGTK